MIRSAITRNPSIAEAHSNLGMGLRMLGRHEDALAIFDDAIGLDPASERAHFNRGATLRAVGRDQDAVDSYDRAIAIRPDFAEAFFARGVALGGLGRLAEALGSYDRAIELRPVFAEAHFNRGNILNDLLRPEDALASYDHAIRFKADFADALFARGNTLRSLGRRDAALLSYDGAIALRPELPDCFLRRGDTLQELGEYVEALASYDRAISLGLASAELYCSRGNALLRLRRHDAALLSYRRAVDLKPAYAEAISNCGNVLLELGRLDEALAACSRALEIQPDLLEALYNRATSLRLLQRHGEASASFEDALRLRPDFPFLVGKWIGERLAICDWRDYGDMTATLARQIEAGEQRADPFVSLLVTDNSSVHRRAAEIWARSNEPGGRPLPEIARRGRSEKIHVGYYSADFHDHATSHLMAGLLETHDRSQFQLTAFSFGPSTGDTMQKRVAAAFDRFVMVGDRSDRDVAMLSRAHSIDIAVDLKGYTAFGRPQIFACRAAPVQVSYLGYPGTTAIGSIDYLIADRVVVPEPDHHYYSEKIAYLPHTYQANDSRRMIPAGNPSRRDLGLPERGFVYCCFNGSQKITPKVFDVWMRILKRVEGSVLWLLGESTEAEHNLKNEASRRGVSAERLVFAARVPNAEHLARYQLADLFLDTLPYGAHTTASDALWAGVPVLTCAGKSFAGRVAASLLRAIDLTELVTLSHEAYEAMAVELASDPGTLAPLRHRLNQNRLTTPLFDTALFTKNIEGLYATMFHRYLSGLPPDHIL